MLNYVKTLETKSIERGHSTDAGIDFYCPSNTEDFTKKLLSIEVNKNNNIRLLENNEGIVVPAHSSILIPSGIHVKFASSNALVAYNKSGVSTKKGLSVLAAVVDSSYEGEVHISLLNTSNVEVIIYFDEKIVQFILLPINLCSITEETSLETLYKNSQSDRKSGGFGSTNKGQ